ncbi:hypothetical protein BDR04DRAFT_1099869 [Suillus decipiens]|nr:hypothetical protein BDR04DRAFT_1099869 [Suillus decipiens]
MRFSFLTAVVALTTSIMSVTAGQSDCTPLGGSCKEDSDCCSLDPPSVYVGIVCLPKDYLFFKAHTCGAVDYLDPLE